MAEKKNTKNADLTNKKADLMGSNNICS